MALQTLEKPPCGAVFHHVFDDSLRVFPRPCPSGRNKYQAKTSGGWGGASGVAPYGTQTERFEDKGREAHERDGSELAADDSFGSRDGLGDRLERADVIDPDGVQQHGDLMNGMGEIGANAPKEAKLDETMSIVETQEFIQVTTNSGALAGLDNRAAQPGEDSTPEQGKAPGSGSESGNPKPRTPDSLGGGITHSPSATMLMGAAVSTWVSGVFA